MSLLLAVGIIGAAAAYHLVQAGARTLLLNSNNTERATNAGAGIIAPESTRVEDEDWFNFAVAAAAYYPTLIEQLTQANKRGRPAMHAVACCSSRRPRMRLRLSRPPQKVILARQQRRGRPSTTDLRPVSPQEARTLFPRSLR